MLLNFKLFPAPENQDFDKQEGVCCAKKIGNCSSGE